VAANIPTAQKRRDKGSDKVLNGGMAECREYQGDITVE
jgi:hypothetical protein